MKEHLKESGIQFRITKGLKYNEEDEIEFIID